MLSTDRGTDVVGSRLPERAAGRGARRAAFTGAAALTLLLLVVAVGVVGLSSGGRAADHLRPVGVRTAAVQPVAIPSAIAHDGGVSEFAAGQATLLQRGRYRYVVHSGDTFLGIASRFHVCTYDVDVGRPLSDQGDWLTPGTSIVVALGKWPTEPDGSVDCVWDR